MRPVRAFAALVLVVLVAGCSVPGPGEAPGGIHDPEEAQNREVHQFNVALDRTVLRPVARAYDTTVPQPARSAVSNFVDTWSTPGTIVNQVLQGRLVRAGRNTLRFVTNATVGLGGLVDVASDLELHEDDSDFGETLHVWGAPEGAYIELPLLGPSTERDAVGRIVDFALDPLGPALTDPQARARTTARVADLVGERGARGETIDALLYDSADSYSQLRLIYLQNRRFALGMAPPEQEVQSDQLALDTEGF